VDLAVTARRSPPDAGIAREYWVALGERGPTNGKPAEYSLIQTSSRGDTLYCGRRASEHFGRVYDKHRETRGVYPDGAWRYEIEYKGQSAKEIVAFLGQTTDNESRIAAIVHKRFSKWGVETPWVPSISLPRLDGPNLPTDDERRLEWLRNQVRPAIETLTASYTGDQIREALGLRSYVISPITDPIGHIPPGAGDP
jgi:DNA relaxase NicK